MKQEEIRQKLIDGTVQVIARDGLDKATTQRIRLATAVNEAYIYRCFEDKEDMFAKTFAALDDELADVTMRGVAVMYADNVDFEERCRLYFSTVWSFMLGSRDKCLTYIQYYYSPYFPKFSLEDHKRRFDPLVEQFKSAFKDEAEVWLILDFILNVILDFAHKVHHNQMPSEDNYSEHVFRVLYASVKQYFRDFEEGVS